MRKILLSLVTVFAVVVMVGGATQAIFSASDNIPNNVVTAGTLTLVAHNFSLNKPIGTTVEKLVPGAWTAEGRAELYNTGNIEARVYMYVDGVTGGACPKTNLEVSTGSAGSYAGEHARVFISTSLANITGSGNRVEVTGVPPFATLGPNWSQVIWQKAQLDSSADNSGQRQYYWTNHIISLHETERISRPGPLLPMS